MGLSIWQLLIIALVVLVLFGRGRISEMMGDFGKGIRSFKEGMNEGSETPVAPPRIDGPGTAPKSGETTDNKSADNQPTSN
ncbi:preprotein translocase subunit TatA [Croceicoccus estronivorus]|uniref:twin-arginine translocase TatA/TatE family subunit n=1 Tax=Croceicoccus estronivorus TaxID=1172626 RepID=UPI00082FC37F|nr:twin-arginine translocase TatA/TatE family subunit [Croceicoccus estronivorus]OCC25227.1 preprotein translocase subunit TatA [Croceicoccus estronivorus]